MDLLRENSGKVPNGLKPMGLAGGQAVL